VLSARGGFLHFKTGKKQRFVVVWRGNFCRARQLLPELPRRPAKIAGPEYG